MNEKDVTPGYLKRKFPNDPRMHAVIDFIAGSKVKPQLASKITQPGHALHVGTPIKFNGEVWVKSQADIAAHAGTVGIVSEVIDENTFRFIEGGLLPGEYTPGASYYLSEITAGTLKICNETTIWENDLIKEFIGYGTPEGLQVNIDRFIEISEPEAQAVSNAYAWFIS